MLKNCFENYFKNSSWFIQPDCDSFWNFFIQSIIVVISTMTALVWPAALGYASMVT